MLLRIWTIEEIETEILKAKREDKIFQEPLNSLFLNAIKI